MTTVTVDGLRSQEEVTAAARSSLYVLVAGSLSYPTPELTEALVSGAFERELDVLAPHLPYDLSYSLGAATVVHEVVEQEYLRLFEVGPGRPPCPPYEGSHRRGRQEIMEDLVRFYEHFGLRHDPGDLPDHLCTELEFVHYLVFKETAALKSGGDARSYVLAQRDFIARHPNRWLGSLRAKLEQMQAIPLYVSLVRLAEEICRSDLAFLERRCAQERPS
ncbi:MAG: molecular chaperone TorD family protein [Dehalococcoidia bacterium]